MGLNDGLPPKHPDRVVFHTLRHSYASWLVKSGVSLYTVQELLGHASITMTQRYSHLAPDTLQAAIQKLEEHMDERPEPAVAEQGNR